MSCSTELSMKKFYNLGAWNSFREQEKYDQNAWMHSVPLGALFTDIHVQCKTYYIHSFLLLRRKGPPVWTDNMLTKYLSYDTSSCKKKKKHFWRYLMLSCSVFICMPVTFVILRRSDLFAEFCKLFHIKRSNFIICILWEIEKLNLIESRTFRAERILQRDY